VGNEEAVDRHDGDLEVADLIRQAMNVNSLAILTLAQSTLSHRRWSAVDTRNPLSPSEIWSERSFFLVRVHQRGCIGGNVHKSESDTLDGGMGEGEAWGTTFRCCAYGEDMLPHY
jgi:hypothetical protein